MKSNTRTILTRIHILVASFFLPVAIIFSFTGGMKLAGFKDDGGIKHTFKVQLDSSEPLAIKDMWDFANKHLVENDFDPVESHALEARDKKSFVWPFGGKRFIRFRPDYESQTGTFNVAIYSVFTRYMSAHKGQAGKYFDYISIGWSVGILILIFTGVYMAISSPELRKWTLISISLGVVSVFVALM